jgi:general secretion pathway protein A
MYEAFYGLKKRPFHITPDPEFLYLSPSHKEALAAIIYGIEQRKGFVTIIGGVGVGKTTILRSYLETVEKHRTRIAYVFNAKLTFEELLQTVYRELGVTPGCNDVPGLVNGLYEVLIEEYKQGTTVVLVIDEAQNMPIDTLENLRMISNLETSKDKLIQIVLVGQPEFEEQLNLSRLRQLKQRLAIRSTILPLTKNESFEYVKFRLMKAGSDPGSVIAPPALREIVKAANGIPRVLNVLCDNALVTGFGYQQRPVTKRIAREIVGDFGGTSGHRVGSFRVAGAGLVLLLLLGGATWYFYGEILMQAAGVRAVSGQEESKRTVVGQTMPTKAVVQNDTGAGAAPSPEKNAPPRREGSRNAAMKTVARGDTLLRLIRDVYGIEGKDGEARKLLNLVKVSNPQITNPEIILPGQRISFPDKNGESPATTGVSIGGNQ